MIKTNEKRPFAGIPFEEYTMRIGKCKKLMEECKIDALLVFIPTNIFYYTGFRKATTATCPRYRHSVIIPLEGDPVIVGDHGVACADVSTWLKDIRHIEQMHDTSPYVSLFVETMKDLKLHNKTIGIDLDPWFPGMWAPDISPIDIESIKRGLYNATFTEAYQLCRKQRRIKSDYEINIFRKCCEITVESYLEAFKLAKEGVTESQINKTFWETFMSREGLISDPVLVGRMTIDQYGRIVGTPVDRAIKKGDFITYNGGGCYRGYHSDVSRIISVGNPTPQQKQMCDAVSVATDVAYENIKPGNIISDVYKKATDAGVKAYKAYGGTMTALLHCGHSIGLDSHEHPWIAFDVDDIALQPGMVLAVELLFLDKEKGLFSGTIENDLVVTKDGYENMCEKLTRDIIVV